MAPGQDADRREAGRGRWLPLAFLPIAMLVAVLGLWASKGRHSEPPALPAPAPATSPPRGVLRVLDEETGEPIAGSSVCWLEWHPEDNSTTYHPVTASGTAGQFLYAGAGGIVEFAVEAPGHVGSFPVGFPVEVPDEGAFKHEFRLPRAGRLRLRFVCDGEPVSPERIRIGVPRGQGGLVARGMSVRGGIGELEGLAPGWYGVVVDGDPGFVLDHAQGVEVRRGETAEDTVVLERRSPESRREAGGARGDSGLPEPYDVESGTATVRIRVIGGDGGQQVAGARACWRCTVDGRTPTSFVNAAPDPRTGEFHLRVPAGELEFRVTAPGWTPWKSSDEPPEAGGGSIGVAAGESLERTVRLRPAGAIRVLLRSGGVPLLRREVVAVLVNAERVGGVEAGCETWWLNGSTGLLSLHDLPPAKYTLQIRDDEGRFDPEEDRPIAIQAGRTTEVRIDLVRRR